MEQKSILLQKLEQQDLKLEVFKRYNKKVDFISKKNDLRNLKALLFLLSLAPISLIIVPSFIFFLCPIILLGILYSILSSVIITKSASNVNKDEQKLLKEYILNESLNMELLFEELSLNGTKNVRVNTVNNIIKMKRDSIIKNEAVDSDDLLIETVNLINKNKEKNVDLINY